MKSKIVKSEKCQSDIDTLMRDKEETDNLKTYSDLQQNLEEIDIRVKELKEENFYLDICKNLLHDTGIKSKSRIFL